MARGKGMLLKARLVAFSEVAQHLARFCSLRCVSKDGTSIAKSQLSLLAAEFPYSQSIQVDTYPGADFVSVAGICQTTATIQV